MRKRNLLVQLLFLIIINLVSSGTPQSVFSCRSPLLKKCLCGKTLYDRQKQYVVNCTDTGFTDTLMLTDLPEETQAVIFTGNQISELPWNIFGELKDLSMLKTIDMSNNGIREIKGKSYHHVANVERLILNHNNLTISNKRDENYHHPRVFSNFINLKELHLTNAFADNTDAALADDLHDIFVNSNLTKLFKIHLEQNEIKGFRDQYVFCDLPSLMDLYLGDNYIPNINFNITCIKNLRFLDFEHNNITKFTQQELNTLDEMAVPHRSEPLVIDFVGNPFRCDAAIKNLYIWMHETKVIVRNKDKVQCHKPKGGNTYILNLKSFAEDKHARATRAVSILLVILSIVFISLLAGYIYLTRDKLRTRLAPLFEIVSRKVQYTNIETQEV